MEFPVQNDSVEGRHAKSPLASEPKPRAYPGGAASFFGALKNPPRQLRWFLGSFFLFAIILIIYRPLLPGSFVIDDASLTGPDNPLVNGTLTPRTIWFQTDFTLATFGWWVQRQVWGENPAGYHAVNLALHALSGILLWRLLARLKISGAWLAAAWFAVHPVCVNSVARISELKNTLSLPFFLLAFLGYLHYEALALYPGNRSPSEGPHSRHRATFWYGASLLAFVMSLLSKTTAVMLPVLLLAGAAWERRRITRSDLLHTTPFFILSLAFGLMSVWFQKHQALVTAHLTLQSPSFGERLAGAGQDIWFYAGKVFWPVNLSVVYPQGKSNTDSVAAWFPILGLGLVLALGWWFRRSWGRHALFGLGCFIISLIPVLGFFESQFLTIGRVSDHLQYLPMIALLALAVAGLATLPGKTIFRGVAIVVILTLSVLTFHRARVFAAQESLVRDTLAKNQSAWTAHNDLGIVLVKRGDYEGAAHEFQNALQGNPDYADARLNLGLALLIQGQPDEAQRQFLAVLQVKPYEPLAHKQLGEILAGQGKDPEALYHLKVALRFKPDADARLALASLYYKNGDTRSAVEELYRGLALNPDQADALNNLAWILATDANAEVRSGTEAVQRAEQACRLTNYKQSAMISTLAAAYAEAGRFPEAIATAEKAVKMQTAGGDARMAEINKQLLTLYRSGKPYHASQAGDKNR